MFSKHIQLSLLLICLILIFSNCNNKELITENENLKKELEILKVKLNVSTPQFSAIKLENGLNVLPLIASEKILAFDLQKTDGEKFIATFIPTEGAFPPDLGNTIAKDNNDFIVENLRLGLLSEAQKSYAEGQCFSIKINKKFENLPVSDRNPTIPILITACKK